MYFKEDAPDRSLERRVTAVGIVVTLALFVLVLRLWDLQIVHWAEFRGISESNRLRLQRLQSPRGMIVGRDGLDENVVLADNRAARDLMFVLAECDIDVGLVCERLATIAHIDGDALRAKIALSEKERQPHRQIVVKKDAPRSVIARVEEYSHALPGVFTVVRPQRRYLYGETGGQLLGYLGEIGPLELEEKGDPYLMGDLVGKAGLERTYETHLKGSDGSMLVTKFAAGVAQIRTDAYGRPFVEVDNYGNRIVEEEVRPPVKGQSLHITLDIGLQARAESLLKGREGAIAVLNANTGEVLALASAPGYDPSIFVTRGTNDLRAETLGAKPSRLLNRGYQGTYPPGSTFKILLASAALEERVIDANTSFYCRGSFRINANTRSWACWKRGGHGEVSVVDAIAFSCDVFFYNVGLKLGVDKISEWSRRLGLGEISGLDLPHEVPGLIPSRAWKEKRLKPKFPNEPWEYRWYPGDTVNLSIGQGAASMTPLQNAVLIAAIVNGGYRVRPYLDRSRGESRSAKLFRDETLDLVRQGLRKCVEKGPPAPTGTGHRAMVPGMVVIGKTGSAQVASLKFQNYENEEDIPVHLRDHAWFVAGVADQEPPIAVCILVEHGHHGSSVAAPLAKDLIEYFYESLRSDETLVARSGSELEDE